MMEIRNTGVTLWKTFWRGKENIRHKFSRARTKGGKLLEVGDKEINGKAVGFWLVLAGRSIKMS